MANPWEFSQGKTSTPTQRFPVNCTLESLPLIASGHLFLFSLPLYTISQPRPTRATSPQICTSTSSRQYRGPATDTNVTYLQHAQPEDWTSTSHNQRGGQKFTRLRQASFAHSRLKRLHLTHHKFHTATSAPPTEKLPRQHFILWAGKFPRQKSVHTPSNTPPIATNSTVEGRSNNLFILNL